MTNQDPLIKGSIRKSQLITTYGVGAVVARKDESFMVAGIDSWASINADLHEPRLERLLRVSGFAEPPASDRRDIPVVRFPEMHYCPTCRRLEKHSFLCGSTFGNKCNHCNNELVPSRFVVACRFGHIDDFPYFAWVHSGGHDRSNKHRLSIRAGGASASLSDIEISCSCGQVKTLQGAFGKFALRGVRNCTGRRPWLGDTVECQEIPRTLQRGGSNVWFPDIRSALSIPPWSEGAFRLLNRHWEFIRVLPDAESIRIPIERLGIAEGTPYSVEDLVAAVLERRRREGEGQEEGNAYARLREEEYKALLNGMEERSGDQDFVCIPAPEIDSEVASWFSHVATVKRLREIRALASFTRLNPPAPADEEERKAPLFKAADINWLPAIDVQGEGIFLQLETDRLTAWEMRDDVRNRAKRIDQHYGDSFLIKQAEPDREITPRLILIHTLAHALINQFALEAGYPAASLRERLYVSEEMAGLLIYTATTDSAGSLGGIVAQAEPDRFRTSFFEAIVRSSWCSADPLCIETEASGVESLNLAACHACALLPEVSCEENNVLLDRGLLTGLPDQADLGYFSPLL